jgi:hypothetical protein
MRSFSSVQKSETRSATDGAGLDVADGQRTGNVTGVQTGTVGAHAEMYFACEKAWAACLEEAMWDVRWQARLRRVQPLGRLVLDSAARIAVETLTQLGANGLDEFLNGVLHDKAHVPRELIPEVKDTWYFNYARGKLGEGIYGEGGEYEEGEGGEHHEHEGEGDGYKSIAEVIRDNASRSGVVH